MCLYVSLYETSCFSVFRIILPAYVIHEATHLEDLWKNDGPVETRYNKTVFYW